MIGTKRTKRMTKIVASFVNNAGIIGIKTDDAKAGIDALYSDVIVGVVGVVIGGV